jgi:hypothetical protein
LDEDAVRVDLQLMLPSVTSRKSSKVLPAAAACAADSGDSDSSYGSSCSSFGSQDSELVEPAQTCGDAVVLQVRPEAAAASSQQAAAPAAVARSSSQASALVTTAAGTAPAAIAAAAGSDDGDDEGLCTICYDQPATCVLMECGHGGYCWRCAHLLFARPPSECPVCRQSIMQVGQGLRECWCCCLCSDCSMPALAALIQVQLFPGLFQRHGMLPDSALPAAALELHNTSLGLTFMLWRAVLQVLELEDPSCQVGRRVWVKSQPTSRQLSKSGSGSWFK